MKASHDERLASHLDRESYVDNERGGQDRGDPFQPDEHLLPAQH
jgi:hypothetical protein